MTDIVVVDSVQTIVYQGLQPTTIISQSVQPKTIITGMMGPRGANGIDGTNGIDGINGINGIDGINGVGSAAELTDVDILSLSSGSILVYKSQTQKWTSTKILDEQIIDCGEY